MKLKNPIWSKEYQREVAGKVLNYIDFCISKQKIPGIAGFCAMNGIYRKDLNYFLQNLEKCDEELYKAWDFFKNMQEDMIINAGFNPRFNATFSIFALKNLCGWKDIQHVEGNEKQIINIIRPSNELQTKTLPRQVHLHRSAVPGNGVSMGNGKVNGGNIPRDETV